MKNLKTLRTITLVYLIIALIGWNLDISEWSNLVRGIFVIVSLILIFSREPQPKKNNIYK